MAEHLLGERHYDVTVNWLVILRDRKYDVHSAN